ncbi:vesicle-associated membrane protein 8 [Fundulus heteroclitus]|uniref:vesicle-associated membrane protein 8 n=1 Tax=Fundulus heteroclitus TaxID=8078 RepID=UPI00165AE3C1|nr:vesicle-associated membrane protein 8 [Fundulus heteroclitus]
MTAIDMEDMEDKESGQLKNKTKEVSDQVEEVKEIMKRNLEKILDREEGIEHLQEVSAYLKDKAENFKRTSDNVARSYWWKNAKLIVAVVVIVLIVVVIIVLLATGVIPTGAPVGPVVTSTSKP